MKAIVDCNSFYCACERVFRPDLRSRPVVVLSNNDGCIVSRSDEAKALGIKMTGPYYQAKPLIEKHGVAVFSSNYNLYGDMSQRVMHTLKTLVGKDKVEVYSIDESFLDLGHVPKEKIYKLCCEIVETVEKWTGIPVSIGVAPSKVLSKAANRLAKKDKLASKGILIADTEEKIIALLKKTPVHGIWGVGRKYATKLENRAISTAFDLRNMQEEWGRKNMGGVVGVRLIKELRGEPCIEMKDALETKKMIATTRMFGKPVYKLEYLKEAVATYSSRAGEKLRRQGSAATCIDVFVVTNNYSSDYQYNPKTHHNHIMLPTPTSFTHQLIQYALPLVDNLYRKGSRYLKAGVILSGLVPDSSIQSNLFAGPSKTSNRSLMEAIDNVNFSMRGDVVKFASSGLDRNWKMRQELRSGKHTTDWDDLYEVR
ncbi:MAG: Y-family DNA polymerase [Chitinophagaceae bacterium]